jgi:hypothetical protein
MQRIFNATVVLVLAFGFFVTYLGHPWPVLAQTNTPINSSGANATSSMGKAANNQSTNSQSGTGAKSSTPEATTAVMKGTPKSAGSANQLQQIEGNNTSVISNNTNVGNKAGLVKGLAQESNSTSAKTVGNQTSSGPNPLSKIPVIGKLFPSKAANATAAGPSKAANATAAGPSKAANATAAGPSKAANATAAGNQTSSNSNPLSKIPILGRLFGGK